jgi:hypothetical protein
MKKMKRELMKQLFFLVEVSEKCGLGFIFRHKSKLNSVSGSGFFFSPNHFAQGLSPVFEFMAFWYM